MEAHPPPLGTLNRAPFTASGGGDRNVVKAEFEEKEFENAANIELALGNALPGRVVAIGQVLEHLLGFDAAARPDNDHLIWTVLNATRPPGLRLVPSMWPGSPIERGALPTLPVSLVIQYKRPEYLKGANSRQWRLWHEPYFRFTRAPQQHEVLRSLEQRVGADLIVRYASPAFWRRGQLEAHQVAGRVLRRTGFVSPTQLGRHKVWTYVRPGVIGRANPSGEEWRFQGLRDLRREILQRPRERDSRDLSIRTSLIDHIELLGRAARYRRPRLERLVARWSATLAQETPLSARTIVRLEHLAAFTTVTSEARATWMMMDLNG